MFQLEKDLWDPSQAFLWPPQSPTSNGSSSSEDDEMASPLLPTWASDPQPSTSNWNFLSELLPFSLAGQVF